MKKTEYIENFTYTLLIAEKRKQLPTATKRDKFTAAVEALGLQGLEPDWGALDSDIAEALAVVLPSLKRGLKARREGEKGGTATQEKRRKERAPQDPGKPGRILAATLPLSKPQPPTPEHVAPGAEFSAAVVALGFEYLAATPVALSEAEAVWLADYVGAEVACSLLAAADDAYKRNPGRKDPAFSVCLYALEHFTKQFDSAFAGYCPKLAAMAQRVTFVEYQALRCRYGGGNVWRKLKEAEENEKFNLSCRCAVSIEKFIKTWIDRPGRYTVTAFDDAPIGFGMYSGQNPGITPPTQAQIKGFEVLINKNR